MTGAEIIAHVLADYGVRQVFGVPGESVLGIVEALDRRGVQFMSTRHEQAAVSMADGYSRVQRRLGVAMVHVGPGAANAMLGMGAAYKDSSPVLLITGNQEQWKLGRDAWHEIDQVAVLSHVTRWNAQAKAPEELPRLLRNALTNATRGRRGPVHLDVPIDVWKGACNSSPEDIIRELDDAGAVDDSPEPNDAAIRMTISMLLRADHPVLFAGGGVVAAGATTELVEVAELLGLAVVTSANGRGIIPENHPLAVGASGQFGLRAASGALRESDFILGIGNRFSDVSTDLWQAIRPGTDIVQVDVEPGQIGRQFPVVLGVVADAGSFLRQLLAELRSTQRAGKPAWRNWAEELSANGQAEREQILSAEVVEQPIKPQELVKALLQIPARDSIVTVGAGVHAQWMARKLVFGPNTYLKSVGFGAMGFAYPAALGAKLGAPDRSVIAVVGDGDFAMTMQEVETAVRYRIPVVAVVFNDMGYGIIKDGQVRRFGGRVIGTDLGNPRFDEFARITGAVGERVERLSDLAPALERALGLSQPALLDVIIDRTERPGHSLYD